VALPPTRVLDTRYGTGLVGVFSGRVARQFQMGGQGGVPSSATAVTGNLTVTEQTKNGFLFIGPVAMDNPTSSTLNFPINDDRANAVSVALAGDGRLSVTYAAPKGANGTGHLRRDGLFPEIARRRCEAWDRLPPIPSTRTPSCRLTSMTDLQLRRLQGEPCTCLRRGPEACGRGR